MATKKPSAKRKTTKARSKKSTVLKATARKSNVTASYLKKYCNLVPDPVDPRDASFMAAPDFAMMASAPLPSTVDYFEGTYGPGDQGQTGSCVGWATTYGLRRWLHFNQTGDQVHFSVRFTWMGAKEIDPWVPNVAFELAGTKIRDAFKVMNKYGTCEDNLWPFSKQLPTTGKQQAITQNASNHRIGAYTSLTTNDERRRHLANKGPFVVGVPVFSNWSSLEETKFELAATRHVGSGSSSLSVSELEGKMRIPDPGGSQRGGHAILVIGYDDANENFLIMNSWGKDWAVAGYGCISYDFMEDHSWSSWGAEPM